MKIVKVVWQDICKYEGVPIRKDIELYTMEDFGYLVYENKDKVIVCGHYCKNNPESANNDCIVIPKSVILQMEVWEK